MCMMKQNGEAESCEVAKSLAKLDDRVTKVEDRLDKMEGSLSVGFTQVNAAIQQLATDFGTRMTNLDTRLIESKVKWGEWARTSLNSVGGWLGKWGGVIILAALGLSNAKSIAEIIRGWCA